MGVDFAGAARFFCNFINDGGGEAFMALSVIGCSVALASPGLLEMLASAVNELVSSAAEGLL